MAVTIKQALDGANELRVENDTGRLDAELLLAHALSSTREHLFTWPEQEIPGTVLKTFDDYCSRRLAGEPVAYIIGKQAFWDFELQVNTSVLIPRPETELLVETAIALLEQTKTGRRNIADLGTGSGAIAIALARQNPSWIVTAVERSDEAIQVAQRNAESLGSSNINFQRGSWCDPLQKDHYDLIAANPPYVAVGDEHLNRGDLRFEPSMALAAEDSGLADLEKIISRAGDYLKSGAWLLLEHGHDQRQPVKSLLSKGGFTAIECKQDYAGIDRLSYAQWSL